MSVNTKDLGRIVHAEYNNRHPHTPLSLKQVMSVMQLTFDEVTEQLACGQKVELGGFAAFNTKVRESRPYRDAATGKSGETEAGRLPYVLFSNKVRERVGETAPLEENDVLYPPPARTR